MFLALCMSLVNNAITMYITGCEAEFPIAPFSSWFPQLCALKLWLPHLFCLLGWLLFVVGFPSTYFYANFNWHIKKTWWKLENLMHR